MKKSLLLGLALLAASPLAADVLTYDLPADWEAGVAYEEEDSRLLIRGGGLQGPSSPSGAPALPYLTVTLPVPKDAILGDVVCTATWAPVDGAARPFVIQAPHVVGTSASPTAEDAAFFGAAAYPATAATVSPQTFSGESVAILRVTPYRWNGGKGVLEKAASLHVEVDCFQVKRLARATADASRLSPEEQALDKIDLVVISPPAWTNLWPLYVDYRKTTHPDLTIVIKNTADIYEAYDGADDALKIHKYLEDLYATKSLKYAILGAGCAKGTYDREKEIPTRACYAINGLSSVSDLYYSCMEKKGGAEVWDYNGDGVYLGSKKSSGGYAGDPSSQIDWTPEIACFRFPVREKGQVKGIKSKTWRTATAEQQVRGLVEKLKRVESASGGFTGDFKAGYSGALVFSSWGRGNTTDRMAAEARFFDGHVNLWDADHAANPGDWEIMTRYNLRHYVIPSRPFTNVVCAASEGAASLVYNSDLEFNTHASHGQDQTASPFEAENFFVTSKIQKILDFSHSCRTGRFDLNSYSGNGNLCLGEASVLNPNGGALVTMNCTRETWSSGAAYETDALLVQVCMQEGLFSLGDGTAGDAFIKGHNRVVERLGGSFGAATYEAGCYVIHTTMGDPLVSLAKETPTVRRTLALEGSQDVSDGVYASALSLAPADGEDALVVSGQTVKAFKSLAVENASSLQFDAPGGVAGSGLSFSSARGDLILTGSSERYFGPRFTNVGNIRVQGSGVTLDFDKTGQVRDITSLGFYGDGAGTSAIRCREGGIFASDLTIPVSNATLVLQTVNVGGVADARGKTPLFALESSTLRIRENPHWTTENLSRTVTMKDSTIDVQSAKAGFGPFVQNAGFNLSVLSGENEIVGTTAGATLSGLVTMDVADGARLSVKIPLTKSAYPGTLVKTGAGTLELRASHTFENGLVVSNGTVVAGSESSRTLGAGSVTVEDGATLKLEAIPLSSIKSLTVKRGGRLILPGSSDKASYQLVDPLTSTLNFEEGALVYNENDEATPLSGNTTSDGYFMNTDSFLDWGTASGAWVNDAAVTPWLTQAGEAAAFADGRSVQFLDRSAEPMEVAISGAVKPDYVNFANRVTPYRFTKGDEAASLAVQNLYTVGATTFEPDVKASAKAIVTQGTSVFSNLVTAVASVQSEAALRVTGTLSPLAKVSKVVLSVSKFQGEKFQFLGVLSYHNGCQVNGLEFLNDGERIALPVGTVVTVKWVFNKETTTETSTETMTVTGLDENGYISDCTGTSVLTNLFDSSASTGWGSGNNGNTYTSKTPTYTVTIDFGTPIEMFSSYRLAGGNSAARSPSAWTLSVTEASTQTSTRVDAQTVNLSANGWWTSGTLSPLSTDVGDFTVAEGGKLYCDGVLNHPLTLEDGAILAVTNSEAMTLGQGLSMKGRVVLDVSEADAFPWTAVTSGAGLEMSDLAAFSVKDDQGALQILDGELYVATQNLTPGPYARTLSGGCAWNTADFSADGTPFADVWSETATLVTDSATLEVAADAVLTVDTDVCLDTVKVVSAAGVAPTLTVRGDKRLYASTLDFSEYAGKVVWNLDLQGARVICGTNEVSLLKGDGSTLSVSGSGVAHLAGSFDTYEVDGESRLDFVGANRAIDYSTLPEQGVFSFEDATVTGAFGRTAVTFLVEDGDAVTFVPTNDALATPFAESLDVRGGRVRVDPKGAAWHFGANGLSTFKMSGGDFSCAATGDALAGSESGLVLGCTEGSSFPAEIALTGGFLALTNSALNFYEAAVLSLSGAAHARVKGAFSGTQSPGVVTVGAGALLEVGASSFPRDAATVSLEGGAMAAYEDGASASCDITVGGRGTLAAAGGTTFAVKGRVLGGGLLVLGDAAHAGRVFLANAPAVEAVVVSNGVWQLGSLRPTDTQLLPSAGAISVTVTNAEALEAETTPIRLVRATALPQGGVQILNRFGEPRTDASVSIEEGYLTVRASSVVDESDAGGESISVSVIGGNANRAGAQVASGPAGAFPVAVRGWNQIARKTNASAVSETRESLVEVLADGSCIETPVSLSATASCAYSSAGTPLNADGELLFGYLDDGAPGATISLSGIPYRTYDLYVYMGSDLNTETFAPVYVTCDDTLVYPAAATAWGDTSSVTGEVALVEGKNYFRIPSLTGSSLTVRGAAKGTVANTRGGISAIQVVNRAERIETYSWRDAGSGVWGGGDLNWQREDGAFAAWPATGARALVGASASIVLDGAVEAFSLQTGAAEGADVTLTVPTGASLTVSEADAFVFSRDAASATSCRVQGGAISSVNMPLVLGRGGAAELVFESAGPVSSFKGVVAENAGSSLKILDENAVLEIGSDGISVPALSLAGTLRLTSSASIAVSDDLTFVGNAALEVPSGEVVTLDVASATGAADKVLSLKGGGTVRLLNASSLAEACVVRLSGATLEVAVSPDAASEGAKVKLFALDGGTLEDVAPFLRVVNSLTLDEVDGTFSVEGGALYVTMPDLLPVAVWNGDFGDLTKGRWTLRLNGNAPSVEGAATNALVIATSGKGVQAQSTATYQALTVLVRCRDLDLESAKNQLLFTTHVSGATAEAGTDQVGLYVKADDTKAYGVWTGDAWSGGTSTAALADEVTGLAFAYHRDQNASSPGVHAYMATNGVSSSPVKVFDASGLRSSGSQYDGFAVGGDWSGLTGLSSASNMVVTALAIFERKLTQDEIAAYEFPVADDEVSPLVWIGGASSSWSDSANWSEGRVPTADDVVCFEGEATVDVEAGDVMPRILAFGETTFRGEMTNVPRLYVSGRSTLDGTATVTSLSGAGTLALEEGATIAPPLGTTLVDFFASWSGVVSGKGALKYTSLPGNATVQAYLQNADRWQATIAFENLDVTWLDLNLYGNASSAVRMTGCRGYLAAAHGKSGYPSSRAFVPTLELCNGSYGYGLRLNNGCSVDVIEFAKVTGRGAFQMSNSAPVCRFFFPEIGEFEGSFLLSGSKSTFYLGRGKEGYTNNDSDNGTIVICGDVPAAVSVTNAVGNVVFRDAPKLTVDGTSAAKISCVDYAIDDGVTLSLATDLSKSELKGVDALRVISCTGASAKPGLATALDESLPANRWRVSQKSDGLYVSRIYGMVIMMK